MMPKRTRTRAQHGAARIATELRQNRDARLARAALPASYARPTTTAPGAGQPPF
ncbi:hypothetical protein K875_01171 [Mycobacterium [tuberculosis] TKK-01-0051]|uniref:Uncharacterized protein n=1 Tax=Mycobacterium [tuberculosis] TKK-01-0051 TaxID=1324261 RepID=A0A051UHS3_9MYCO|nr:hypothetical protein K875_01171 [Mycobacterium [tuberculosis] TKK-01-0051]